MRSVRKSQNLLFGLLQEFVEINFIGVQAIFVDIAADEP